ncbi:MAG: polyprenyl synthetase family protein [Gemmatimonadetes bacterium]|nr:polyprenyl synthetase family protein [Gemmatimonadota bacterium]
MSQLAERFDLERWLGDERGAVERALQRAMAWASTRLPDDPLEVVRHGVLGGGKRVRPLLRGAAWRAVRGDDGGDALYDVAAAPELVHAYSLRHDALPSLDDADLRRGRPTTHRVHGEAATVAAGAALIPLGALQAWRACRALEVPAEAAREVVATLMRAAGGAGMVGGQALDLLGEGRRLDAGELDALHRRKTGALLVAPLRMGALAAGAGEPLRTALESYGRSLGLAFQIADDILDATASAGDLGKNPSDAALEKSTWVALHGLDQARRRASEEARLAVEALDRAGLEAPPLRALAAWVVRRRR